MKVLKIEATYALPEVIEIEGTLEELQKLVGGYIQVVRPFNNNIIIICNEEGKIKGLDPTRALVYGPEAVDVLVGPLIVCAVRPGGVFAGLTDEEIEKYQQLFNSFIIIPEV